MPVLAFRFLGHIYPSYARQLDHAFGLEGKLSQWRQGKNIVSVSRATLKRDQVKCCADSHGLGTRQLLPTSNSMANIGAVCSSDTNALPK